MGKKFGIAGLYNFLKPFFFQKKNPPQFYPLITVMNWTEKTKVNIFYVFDQTAKYEKIFLSKEIDAIISL